ncbi:MAG: hypothetical protein ACRBBW_14105 [Cellvibrionaceae bacterium]
MNKLFATRKNPYIPQRDQFETVKIDLSGTKLSLKLPPHSSMGSFAEDPIPTKVNIFNEQQYTTDDHVPDWQREGVSFYTLINRDWELRGPIWRERPYGKVSFYVGVNKQETLPSSMSCFNPAHLEQLVRRHIYFGGPACPGSYKTIAPVNWKVHQDQCTWLYYEAHRDFREREITPENAYEQANLYNYLFIPLSQSHYIDISFRYLGYAPAEYCLENMNRLRDQVLAHINCQLSTSAQQELATAKQRWPEATASTTREPEQWTYPEWREPNHLKGEIGTVILKPGSPPPPFTP